MEAAGLAFSVAQTLLATLSSPQLKELFSIWKYELELEELERTVKTVQAVLSDAESKKEEELSHCARDFIEKLKDALYDADDLLDQVATLAQQQNQPYVQGDKKFLRKVRRSFSRLTNFKVAYSMSKEVKNIRKKLDLITTDANKFGLQVNYQPVSMSKKETCSVADKGIIGREDDQRRIVDILLEPNVPEVDVPILTIVGVGGLGKTALAQLVYNDDKISKEFGDRKFWVCVSDQDPKEKDKARKIFAEILQSVTRGTQMGDLTYNYIVQQLREKLGEDKYLLVLDDVWTEDPLESQNWLNILTGSASKGSRIVVTTRSKKTAMVVGCNHPYELQGLSDEVSWQLFQTMVGIELANRHDLVEVGKDLVNKCVNVPLAIKVVGSFLQGQNNKDIWISTQQSVLNTITEGGDGIMPILKFSYYHLSPPQRSCFTYCAVFPEDYQFNKKVIISLWMANNYVIKDEDQDIEALAENFFEILVQRCFFQDVEEDYAGRILFKIHDLMHEMARKVAGKEIAKASSATSILDKKIRHLYDTDSYGCTEHFMTTAKLRSYFVKRSFGLPQFLSSALLKNWRTLRVLDLSLCHIKQLPDSIGELFHLRYLDLSSNRELKRLPDSLTKLINLQFFYIICCVSLQELPKKFNLLVNLKALGIDCGALRQGLEYMPLGLEKMTCLTELDRFTVGHKKSSLEQDVDRVRGLRGLSKLRGSLHICITENYKHIKETDGKGSYLCNAAHLKSVFMRWRWDENDEEREIDDEDLLEDLQPHPNLERLEISRYPGEKIPTWAKQDSLLTHLPNLDCIELLNCTEIRELPRLCKLQYLRVIFLHGLHNLEFIEDGGAAPLTLSNSSTFFPSLKCIYLENMPKLKGWWKENNEILNRGSSVPSVGGHGLPSFPQLYSLYILSCLDLASIPLCPTLEIVELDGFNEKIQIIKEEEEEQKAVGSSNNSGNMTSRVPKIRNIVTSNVRHLNSLPVEAFQCLEEMKISDSDLETLSEVEVVFRCCSSSLRSLEISKCEKLRTLSGLEYLTNLEDLCFHGKFLDSMPEVIRNLTSLNRLKLIYANEILQKRCVEPDGEDWPIIRHITHIELIEYW